MSIKSGEVQNNAFRLPPSDEESQAPAVAHLTAEVLKAKRIFLLQDSTRGAEQYSIPLFNQVDKLLGGLVVDRNSIIRGTPGITGIPLSIKAQKADAVILCGYGTTAQEFLASLRLAYAGENQRPLVILTDGARISDLDASGFRVFVTFPLKPMSAYDQSTRNIQLLTRLVSAKGHESYEMFGYDAVLIASEAIQACEQEQHVDRLCITRQLRRVNGFHGAALDYTFVDGENALSNYYVYEYDGLKTAKAPTAVLFESGFFSYNKRSNSNE